MNRGGLADFDVEERRLAHAFHPGVLLEPVHREDDGFVERLRLDDGAVTDASAVSEADGACADRHVRGCYYIRCLFAMNCGLPAGGTGTFSGAVGRDDRGVTLHAKERL